MIFDLVKDFADVLDAMPEGQSGFRTVSWLGSLLRGSISFLHECPTSLFQLLRNELSESDDSRLKLLLSKWESLRGDRRRILARCLRYGRAKPQLRRLNTPHFEITAFAVLSSELQLATAGSDGSICLWDREQQQQVAQHSIHQDRINALAAHPKQPSLLSGYSDGSVCLSHPVFGIPRKLLARHEPCHSVCISTDGRWMAAGWYDGQICLWRDDSTEPIHLIGPSFCVRSLQFSYESRHLAAGTDDLHVFVWELQANAPPLLCSRFLAHELEINDLVFLERGELLATASSDGSVRIWDWNTGQCQTVIEGHATGVFSIACRGNGDELATGSSDHSIRIWKNPYQRCEMTLVGHESTVTGLRYLRDGTLLSVAKDSTIREWNLDDQEQVIGVPNESPTPNVVRVSIDGTRVVVGHAHGLVSTWELTSSPVKRSRMLCDAGIVQLSISRDGGQIVAGTADSGVWLLTPELDSAYRIPEDSIVGKIDALSISPEVGVLAVAFSRPQDSFATISIWDIKQRKKIGSISHRRAGGQVVVAVNDKGDQVAVASYGCVAIYNSQQAVVAEFRKFTGEVSQLAFGAAPLSIAFTTQYATRIGVVGDDTSWQLLPKGGPAHAIARRDLFRYWLTPGGNNSLWRSADDGTIWGGLPGVPTSYDVSSGEFPVLAVIVENELAVYRWT